MTSIDVANLQTDVIVFLAIFSWGVFFGVCLTYIYKNFTTSVRLPSLNRIKKWFFPPKICHCGLTKNAPYCDKSHAFCFRIFRWWKWINEDLDDKRK